MDVKDPGVMATLVAPVAAQPSVLVAPEVMLVGVAAKEVIVGAECGPENELDGVTELQPASPKHANRISDVTQRSGPEAGRSREMVSILQNKPAESKGSPLAVSYNVILANTVFLAQCPSKTDWSYGITLVTPKVVGKQSAFSGS